MRHATSERSNTAVGRWWQEEETRVPGPGPATLLVLPLIAITLLLRFAGAPPATAEAVAPRPLLEVLVTETGFRLRLTDVSVEGFPPPLRAEEQSFALVEGRTTYVYRTAGVDARSALLSAARDLVGHGVEPKVWLRGDDAVPWNRMLDAAEALGPLTGSADVDGGPLARVAVDARP